MCEDCKFSSELTPYMCYCKKRLNRVRIADRKECEKFQGKEK